MKAKEGTVLILITLFLQYEAKLTRISNGEADEKPRAYQAALLDRYNEVVASATLISTRWLLCAAHPIQEVALLQKAKLGALNWREHEPGQQVIALLRQIQHPNFNPATLDNDIGLLLLAKEARLTHTVKPALLPADDGNDYVGKVVVASGWGSMMEGGPNVDVLRWINTTVIPYERCRMLYPWLTRNMICTDSSDRRTICPGDSGGPLVYFSGEEAIIIGVISFDGNGCGLSPSGYTAVNRYIEWIFHIINDSRRRRRRPYRANRVLNHPPTNDHQWKFRNYNFFT